MANVVDLRERKVTFYDLHKFQKINRTRRSRGYSFESSLVKRFNDIPNWSAKRLGGASTYLPDIIATSYNGIVFSIEAKSTKDKNDLYIPPDQVLRCIDVLSLFSYAYVKNIIFAFKFGQGKNRKLKEFFFSGEAFLDEHGITVLPNLEFIKCNRSGKCIIKLDYMSFILKPYSFNELINPNYKF